MAALKVEVYLDSDAMCVDAPHELGRIFARITESFADVSDPLAQTMTLRDSNGNSVGEGWIEED